MLTEQKESEEKHTSIATCEDIKSLNFNDESVILDLAVEAMNEMIETDAPDFDYTSVEYALFTAEIKNNNRCVLCLKYMGDCTEQPCVECPLSVKRRGGVTPCFENSPGEKGILATWNHLRSTDKKAAKRYMINVTQMVMEYDQ